ncbi:adenosylmethionine--8-amino-7-oxononanoate transaminase [Bermanella sp. WJH001]|uniref:adenosylmethionine--8-amino-7-oxononanoate transaminase n=1 Tax=Bermanella sp. WJH001 TaxID=3048005 RepID=UPI0024BE7205|nr:adenosylmethionine--8-amino-7-oxononanoate transaminase [Bermanella sp. WJH001]MDJ1536861.1 adenosylmethionine--8-amino-7-oxononanoate transaminase [Bermanella sp. WJH001]
MAQLTPEQISNLDQQHVWHPYSSFTSPLAPFPVASTSGVRITLADGRELIDGMASWWSAVHGYGHPKLKQAAHDQIETMSHVMFGGLTHEPAVTLCEKLVKLAPQGLNKVFISDSGSVAVEVAIKMAFQYSLSQGNKQKNKLLTVKNGYHGDTFATMATCDPVNGMHHMFENVLSKHIFAQAPQCLFGEQFEEHHIADVKQKLETHHASIAAIILEPIVQGAGGMRFYSPDYLKRIRELCDEYKILLIADEIATGFGRTGKMFACEHAGISPDILCVGKALTGGFMSLAATLCTDKVAKGICEGEAGVFMHGPTFMGNPLACAVANASLDVLMEGHWPAQVAKIQTGLEKGLAPARALSQVKDVRVLGAIGVIELHEPVHMPTVQPMFVEEGVWVRPFGKLVYVLPPFIINEDDLAFLTNAMVKVVSKL